MRAPCDMSTPLGLPVDPEVKNKNAGELSATTGLQRLELLYSIASRTWSRREFSNSVAAVESSTRYARRLASPAMYRMRSSGLALSIGTQQAPDFRTPKTDAINSEERCWTIPTNVPSRAPRAMRAWAIRLAWSTISV